MKASGAWDQGVVGFFSSVERCEKVVISGQLPLTEREFCIDNLLVRIHFIIRMVKWTGLAPWEFEFLFSGSLTSIFLKKSNKQGEEEEGDEEEEEGGEDESAREGTSTAATPNSAPHPPSPALSVSASLSVCLCLSDSLSFSLPLYK